MSRIRAVILLACAALAGCSGSVSAPPVPTDLFTLAQPVVLENEVVRIELQNEILSLYANSTARREYRQRLDYTSPQGRDTTFNAKQDYHFHVDGTTIELTAMCDDTALCAPGPHLWGTVTAQGLELRTHFDPDVVLRYRRVP